SRAGGTIIATRVSEVGGASAKQRAMTPNPLGQISMNWIDTTLAGQSMSDGTLLFQACFTAIAEDAISIITITGPSILNNQGQTLSFLGEGGTVLINDVVTSTDDRFEQSTNFKLYPVPARSELTMEWPDRLPNEDMPLYILNLEGKVVHTGQVRNSKQTFTIDHLAPGIYYLVVKGPQKLQYKQFLKL
ncbi:MAG: T9SS type A sorting domain-containing protein, partial [Bacteroidota bacterium]